MKRKYRIRCIIASILYGLGLIFFFALKVKIDPDLNMWLAVIPLTILYLVCTREPRR